MAKKKVTTHYEIDSFEKLINLINEDNFEHLTTDLIMWLGYQIKFMASVRKQFPKSYLKGKTNWDLCQTRFIYIADGKHDMKSVVLKNTLTGEVKTFELKARGAV